MKLVQLRVAERLGIPTPATLVTNSAAAALTFLDQVRQVVAKPVRYGLVSREPEARIAWTTQVSRSDLADLEGTPVILQHAVQARAHLRITTVRDRAFIGRLTATELDWRSRIDNHECFEPMRGDKRLIGAALEIARALGVGFSAQDWIEDRDGHILLLEANPNGQWQFLDPVFKDEIISAVVVELERLAGLGASP